MNKILFLDLDGVINSIEYSVGMSNIERSKVFRMDDCDPVKLGLIRYICNQTGAKIVISSTWRIGKDIGWFEGYFEAMGWPMPPIIGMTTTDAKEKLIGRGDEVAEWLSDNHIDWYTHPTFSYAILDDDKDFFDYQPTVFTNKRIGLTIENALDCIDLLGKGDNFDQMDYDSLRSYYPCK